MVSIPELIKAWTQFANVKEGMADFKFASYPKKSKHSFPSFQDAEKFAALLEALLRLAPKGYPNFPVLQAVLFDLHNKYGIFGEKLKKDKVWKVCGDHGDMCKTICTIGFVCHIFSSLLSCHEQTHSHSKSTLVSLPACLIA